MDCLLKEFKLTILAIDNDLMSTRRREFWYVYKLSNSVSSNKTVPLIVNNNVFQAGRHGISKGTLWPQLA